MQSTRPATPPPGPPDLLDRLGAAFLPSAGAALFAWLAHGYGNIHPSAQNEAAYVLGIPFVYAPLLFCALLCGVMALGNFIEPFHRELP